ncbi:MAG: cytidine deaminase [Bacteroidota bacterium]
MLMAEADKKMEINWQAHASLEELSTAQQVLLQAAVEALDKAYAPYSNFHVGAAVRLNTGEILNGANFENAAYPMCLCAERSTLASAVSNYPNSVVEAMAITVRNPEKPIDQPAAPCGACRQVLVEAEGRQSADIEILMRGESGPIYVLSNAKLLLPFYFSGSFL